MTHGDQAKAKKAASKASGDKKSSKAVTPGKAVQTAGKTEGKAVQSGKTGKTGKTGKEGGGKAIEARPKAVEKSAAGPKAAAAVKAGNDKSKARVAAPEPPGGFTNPVVAGGFKRALKKFPNAFRRLTD